MFSQLWAWPRPPTQPPAHSCKNIGFIGFIGTVLQLWHKSLEKLGQYSILASLYWKVKVSLLGPELQSLPVPMASLLPGSAGTVLISRSKMRAGRSAEYRLHSAERLAIILLLENNNVAETLGNTLIPLEILQKCCTLSIFSMFCIRIAELSQ